MLPKLARVERPIKGRDALFEKIIRFAAGNEPLFHAAVRRWTRKRMRGHGTFEQDRKQTIRALEPLFPFSKAYFDADEKFVLIAAFHDSHPDANKGLCPWDLERPATGDNVGLHRWPFLSVIRAIQADLKRSDILRFERLLGDLVEIVNRATLTANLPQAAQGGADSDEIEGYDALFERIVGFAHDKEPLFRDAIFRISQRISAANAATARPGKPPSFQPDKSPFTDAHFDDDEALFWLAAFHDSHREANEKLSPWPIELDQSEFERKKIVYNTAAPEAKVYAFAVTMTANWMTTDYMPRFERLLAQCEAQFAGSDTAQPSGTAKSLNPVATADVSQSAGVTAVPPIKRPSEKAFQAWRLRDLTGINNQTELAAKMTQQGTPANQGQVSRWLKEVGEYLAAGNVLPNLPLAPAEKPQPFDPKIIDMGKRDDGRTPRQRLRGNSTADDE